MAADESGTDLTQRDKDKIRAQLKELEDRGLIDLDAPLRETLPVIQRIAEARRTKVEAEARAGWWCFIGDAFIICDITIEF
jgi:hypothetical protein